MYKLTFSEPTNLLQAHLKAKILLAERTHVEIEKLGRQIPDFSCVLPTKKALRVTERWLSL
ncbi:hypothetical protein C4564_04915 [Candidatus Microgenomates bacterium]|nr:MAG: hypothetical protein C4564_04915 [Candidatus Microgenomates bacterium]